VTAAGSSDPPDETAIAAGLVRGLAHELKTPLQFAADSIHFIERAWAGLQPADGAEPATEARIALYRREMPAAIDRVRDGVQRIAELVRTLSEIARSSSAEVALDDPNRVVRVALAAAHHDLKYLPTVELALGDVPMVPCRSGQLARELASELVRAAAAIGARGDAPLRVASRVEGDEVVVDIAAGAAPASSWRLSIDG
jgi:signal transduction histidine kinase